MEIFMFCTSIDKGEVEIFAGDPQSTDGSTVSGCFKLIHCQLVLQIHC